MTEGHQQKGGGPSTFVIAAAVIGVGAIALISILGGIGGGDGASVEGPLVLWPADPDFQASATLNEGEGRYALRGQVEGAEVRLSGTMDPQQVAALSNTAKQNGVPEGHTRYSLAHGVLSAQFIRGSRAYWLDIECADAANPKCADKTYARVLIEGLGPKAD